MSELIKMMRLIKSLKGKRDINFNNIRDEYTEILGDNIYFRKGNNYYRITKLISCIGMIQATYDKITVGDNPHTTYVNIEYQEEELFRLLEIVLHGTESITYLEWLHALGLVQKKCMILSGDNIILNIEEEADHD